MMDLLTESEELLRAAGFVTQRATVDSRDTLVFEDSTVVGFMFVYGDARSLLSAWEADSIQMVSKYQFGLRRAAKKAWNLYAIFVSADPADSSLSAGLNAIEEDLTGMRKIARAGVSNSGELREVLLPLLPLHAAPRMQAVEIRDEIRLRATEIERRVLDAFLSDSDDGSVLQVLEDES